MNLQSVLFVTIFLIMSVQANVLQKSMSSVKLFGRHFFVKRDDLLFSYKEGLSGNKGRKLCGMLSSSNICEHLFSYGGYQSNSLLALSRVASIKKLKLHYFTLPVPAHLKESLIGNHLHALTLGTKIVEVNQETYSAIKMWSEAGANMNVFHSVFAACLPAGLDADTVEWVPQGGCMPTAEKGVTGLAVELQQYIASSNLMGPWKIIVASGTGTMAYFLGRYFGQHNHAGMDVQVFAAPCVGTADYLAAQMDTLDRACGATGHFPQILPTSTAPKRTFAKPTQDHLDLWNSLQRQAGIEFDLIYAPRAFEVLLSTALGGPVHPLVFQEDEPVLTNWFQGANLIYYHCGGVEGNESQMSRYRNLKLS